MNCPDCGFENLKDSTFCTQCGYKFLSDKTPAPSSVYQSKPAVSLLMTVALSLTLPGAGHVYLGYYLRACGLLILGVVSLAGAIYYFGTLNHFVFFMLFAMIIIFSIADAYRIARQKNDLPYKLDRIYTVVGVGFCLVVVTAILWMDRYYSFITVEREITGFDFKRGDKIMVSRRYYVDHEPQVGDLIVRTDGHYGTIDGIQDDIIYTSIYRIRVDQDAGKVDYISQPVKFNIETIKDVGKMEYVYAPIKRRSVLNNEGVR